MSGEGEPEVATVTSKGQITIPSKLREKYEIKEGDRLIAIPTELGIVLKKIELPSIEEFKKRVEKRSSEIDLSNQDIEEIIHDKRST